MKEKPNEKMLLTIKEACERIGISRTMIHKLWNANKGPKRIEFRTRVYISQKSLDLWIEQLENKKESRRC